MEETIHSSSMENKPYWSEETNRKRSESLKGQRKTFDQRAQMYASHKTGRKASDNDPQWIEYYRHRLSDLRMQEHLRVLAEQGVFSGKPIQVRRSTQLGKLMYRVTKFRLDSDALAKELRERRMSFETLKELAALAKLSREEIDDVLEGRAETVRDK